MASLTDIAQPLTVDGEQTLWLKEPTYVTGGRVVVTGDSEQTAAALTVSGTTAAIELKDADAFVIRNKKYDNGTQLYETLPLQTTRDGRVLVNAPGLIPDADSRVADAAMTVFGGLKADRIKATTLDVQDITSLNFRYVKGIEELNDQIVVTHEDNTTSELPVGWDTIKNKPETFPVDAQLTESIPYLTNRVQLAQYNVDFLLREVTRLQTEVDSLDRLTVNDNTTFGPPLDGPAMATGFQGAVDAGKAAVRSVLV
jgi:hypothetical protein